MQARAYIGVTTDGDGAVREVATRRTAFVCRFVNEPGRISRQRNHARCRDLALEKQSASEAVGLRTRECHSALTAMRRSRRERKRDSIYPHYSGVRRSWPVDASEGPA